MTIYKDLKIGSSVNGTSQRYTYNITSSVSSVSGADANGNTLAYDSGFADVYLNGVRLSGADITITSGNSVSFASNLSNGDVVDIVAYGAFAVASINADNISSGTVPDARITGAYTGITNLTMSGLLTSNELNLTNGGVIHSTTNTNSVFIAGGTDSNVGSNIGFYGGSHSSHANRIRFRVGSSEIARFDASGNFGIGTSAPTSNLSIQTSSGEATADLKTTDSDTGVTFTLDGNRTSNNGIGSIVFSNNGDSVGMIRSNRASANDASDMLFYTQATGGSNSERMRITSDGDLLIGKSALEYDSTAGIILRNDGLISCIRSGGNVTDFNRLSSDGEIARFSKDGTTVGRIGARGGNLYVGNDDVALKYSGTNDAIFPSTAVDGSGRDNAIDLGASGTRFKDIYLGGGAFLGGTGTANKLDDYEEGTWTGTISDGTNNATMGSNTGGYVKIGSLVVLTGYFTISSLGSVSGNLRLTGLPFACGSSNAFYTSNGLGWGANLSITDDTSIGFQLDTNASHLNFTHWDNTSGTTILQSSQLTASGQFMMNLSYRTDA